MTGAGDPIRTCTWHFDERRLARSVGGKRICWAALSLPFYAALAYVSANSVAYFVCAVAGGMSLGQLFGWWLNLNEQRARQPRGDRTLSWDDAGLRLDQAGVIVAAPWTVIAGFSESGGELLTIWARGHTAPLCLIRIPVAALDPDQRSDFLSHTRPIDQAARGAAAETTRGQ